jgi:copper chaperone CopZ
MLMGHTFSRAGRVAGSVLGVSLAMVALLLPVTAAHAEVEAVTVRLEDERCSACTARIASNLRRLEGVRSVESNVVAGTVSLLWRPGVPLEVAQIKEAVLRSTGTHQPFCLKAGTTTLVPPVFRPGQAYRVTGRVIKSGEGKHDEIWLQLESAEPVGNDK